MLSYWMVHDRMEKATGTCVCGKPATEWAYQHTGEKLVSPEGRVYSENPDDYKAMCRSCHHKLDREATPERFSTTLDAQAKAVSALSKRWNSDPEFAERRKSELKTGLNKKRRCLECGKVSTTYGMARHQTIGHVGYEDVS